MTALALRLARALQPPQASQPPGAAGPRSGRPVAGSRRRLPALPVPVFVGLVTAVGLVLAVVVVAGSDLPGDLRVLPLPVWLLCLGLAVGELGPIPVARGDERTGSITMSTIFAVALVATGPFAVLLAVHTLVVALDDVRTRREPRKIAFNAGQYAVSLVAARAVFALVGGEPLLAPHHPFTAAALGPVLCAGLVFVVANNALVAVVVALDQQSPVLASVGRDLHLKLETSAVLVALAPVAAVLAQTSGWLLPLLALPVLAVRRSAVLAAARRVQAMRDPLTGLGNRDLFFGRAARQLERSAVTGEPVCVLMLDLDHFKDINDTLGHQIGDLVLQEIGRRIAPVAPEPGCVARLGGDEFAVLLPGVPARGGGVVAEQLLADIVQPLQIGGTRFSVQASIGIASLEGAAQAGTDAEQLSDVTAIMQRADIALYDAKRERARWALYDDDAAHPGTPERLSLLADLREAVTLGQLSVSFQPQVSLHDGEVSGTEALARWTHPERGVIDPEEFIALAENAGLISQVTDLVLEDSLAALDRWNAAGLASRVSVNLSARQLSDLSLPERVGRALARHDVQPAQLTVEVTESSMMGDPRRAGQILRELRRLGVRVAVDDFGTGYSSLAYLQGLDLDEIKVDRSFVRAMSVDGDDVLVRSIIELGHNLGLSVVAEGVEHPEQLDRLRALGCDVVQGYHVGRPMTGERMTAWLRGSALPEAVVPAV
ncbi:putative bifunctional diguanylate cyclase/phosphodiesterase [Angustibacter aerolatus]